MLPGAELSRYGAAALIDRPPITDGIGVTIWACARNGANGALQFCAAKVGIA